VALLGKRVAVAVPDTLLEEKDSLRDKTVKLGSMARAIAIYGVDLVEVFRDPAGKGDGALIRKVLEYLETPQYLRKRLYPIDEDLRFAGILPPLRIPSHSVPSSMEALEAGQLREGVANPDGTVEVGLAESPRLIGKARANARVTVRVESKQPFTVSQVPSEEAGDYWGYHVESRRMEEVFSDPRFGLKIATSRLGRPLSAELPRLRGAMARADGVKLVFGSPSRGLFDMVGQGLATRADFVVNLFVGQQTETVRTEEAVFAGLSLVNLLLAEKGLSAN
jgi:predicted SPOUT superfamily RNA methylase MTH1